MTDDPDYEPLTSCICNAIERPPCSWCEGDGGADPDEESE